MPTEVSERESERGYSDGICKLSEVYAVLAEDVTYFLACDSFLFHVLWRFRLLK